MAWYPGAKKMELQPESDAQAAIRPTQFIVHSIVAAWTARRTYEFWRDSTNLESHFGIGYGAHDIAQYVGTETRADANAQANRRADGTGAISVETASNSKASDPWNASQVEELIQLGVWAHQRHGIPLRICRTSGDPGFGYHSMFAAWSTSGTACPGPARIRQFRQVVFPAIVARATGKTPAPSEPSAPADPPTAPGEDPMPAPMMLAESNPIDVALTSGAWTGLALTDAVLHAGPRRHATSVHLLFAGDLPEGTTVEGRFYLTDTAGKGKSDYLPDGPHPLHGGGHQFTCTSDVPAGRHLRFEVRATTPDGSPVTLLHRSVSGPHWAI